MSKIQRVQYSSKRISLQNSYKMNSRKMKMQIQKYTIHQQKDTGNLICSPTMSLEMEVDVPQDPGGSFQLQQEGEHLVIFG